MVWNSRKKNVNSIAHIYIYIVNSNILLILITFGRYQNLNRKSSCITIVYWTWNVWWPMNQFPSIQNNKIAILPSCKNPGWIIERLASVSYPFNSFICRSSSIVPNSNVAIGRTTIKGWKYQALKLLPLEIIALGYDDAETLKLDW